MLGKSLKENFRWVLMGNSIYAACQWACIIVLARLGDSSLVGQFALALAIATPVYMFTNLHLRTVLATDSKSEHDFSHYLYLRILTLVGSVLIISIISIIFLDSTHAAVTSIVAVGKGFEYLSDIMYGNWQRLEQMRGIAISMMIRGILSLLGLLVGLVVTNDMIYAVLGFVLGSLLPIITYDFFHNKALSQSNFCCRNILVGVSISIKQGIAKKIVILALPLGLVVMLISLQVNVPRYFIQFNYGDELLGVFSALCYPLMLGSILVNALGQSATPRLSRFYSTGDIHGYQSLTKKLAKIGVLLGVLSLILIWFVGKELLGLVYGEEYSLHSVDFMFLGVAVAIDYISSFYGNAVNATRAFRRYIVPYLIVTVFILAGSVFLIPLWGLKGAAVAIFLANLTKLFVVYGLYKNMSMLRISEIQRGASV